MKFGSAIKSGFNGYFNFSGRSSRSEFWWWWLFYNILAAGNFPALIFLLDQLPAYMNNFLFEDENVIVVLFLIIPVGLLLPSLAVLVRRLHDLELSGWWMLISLIPLVGPIILLVWACSKGTEGENWFGSDPLG